MKLRKIASLSLALALQVLPLTRVFVASTSATGSSFAIVSTWIAGALALMGGVDAVSGASSISISPATATAGVAYSGIVQYSGAHASSAQSWELKNNWNGAQTGCGTSYQIAPGLWVTNAASYLVRIGGTPTTSGTFSFTLKIWSGTGCSGGDSDTRSATITVSGGTAVAPTITTQPVSQTVTAGANVSFSVAASGTAPLSYQWKLNGANVTGGTAATLTLTAVTTGQAGSYTCLVTNATGSATSSAATLTVNPPPVAPSITTQPLSQTVTAGANASFTVVASGTAPLSYQWKQNGANVSGGTAATLSLTGVTAGQAGSYTCVVTNAVGSATSSAATLTVNVPPTITTQPTSLTVTAGGNVSFTVAASGTAPLSYQWQLNGASLGGATSATLNLTGVTVGQAGSYTCLVTNVAGSITSSAATLAVNPPPVAPSITTQPLSQTVIVGANASFTIAASGTAPLSYQWQLNGANLGGATSATLSLTAVTTGQAGSYTCVVTNAAGSATSSAATLTVNVPPTITTQPTSQTVTAGGNVSFTVAASGTAPLSYQWQLNGANLGGATSATLSLTGVTVGQAGSYTCLVTNVAGSITSGAATLVVNPPPVAPSITTQPLSQTVIAGANASFTVAASGTAPLSYQWQLNGANLGGATSATLSLTGVTTGQAGSYTCVVTNAVGSATSSAATLTVNVPPTITTQPANQSVIAGGDASFSVVASGAAPLSYQWLRNGVNVGGATSATLSLTAVTTNQAGSYACVVTNVAGSATSTTATLTVDAAPVAPSIATQPLSQTVTAGANVSFTVAASGTSPLSYQWLLNGASLGGATSATLSLTSVTTNQAGSYSCVVTNVAGSATSGAATLTVNPPPVAPSITVQPASQTVIAGGNVSFTVAASGTAPLSYQWLFNGTNLGGATGATLNLTAVTAGQAGSYSCVVTNVAGNATSSAATLTVNVPPTITTPPVSQNVTAGANVSFTVAASGTAPLSYQWLLNGANLSGATSATLSLTSVTTNQAGSYACVVTNVAGSVTSGAATLAVSPAPVAPSITTQPVSQTVIAGANVSFNVVASGTTPLSYQWQLNGANLSGATSATLSLTTVTTSQAGSYSCVVTNGAGNATSSAATLTVNVPPAITTPPVSQTVTAGANVSFTVAASGTAPLSYQWRLNGANLGGATSATLSLTSVTTNQAGSYACVVTNVAGTATSATATLTVNVQAVAPMILSSPASQTVTAGANVSFTVVASGTAPLSYQWRLNGVNISGATSATLSLTSVTTNQSGSYTCLVTNAVGSATSSGATLTVQAAPNPYAAGVGTYNGLFFESAEIRVRSAGTFSLHADALGNYTGWLQLGYTRYSVSGKLDVNLNATNVITRWNGSPLTIELRIGQNAEAGQAFGRVSDGVWSSPLSGGRPLTTSPYAGDYTVVIPGLVGDTHLPAGDSYATLHVGADGLATMNGTLADGSIFAQSAYVTAQDEWPMFVSLYSANGVIVSWLRFANLTSSDLSGALVWVKQAGASATSYPAGFTNETTAVGSLYVPPMATGKAVNLSSAGVTFSGGILAAPFTNAVSVNAGSQVVNLSPNPLTLNLATDYGTFTGQVTQPGAGVSRTFGGVILQKQNAGFGMMNGVNTSSRVVFTAP